MNVEFHYYVTYLLALKAGFQKEDSYKIAYSSQFVDDNKASINVVDENMRSVYRGTPTQIEMLSSGQKRDNILQKHHFVHGDSPEYPLMTTPNSKKAQFLLKHSLKKGNVYLIGIASHAYFDTWSHQGFIGSNSDLNSMPTWSGKLIPNIGHADALDDPDSLDSSWIDLRHPENGVIKNSDRFFEAATNLYSFYHNSVTGEVLTDPAIKIRDLKKIFRFYRSRFRIGRNHMFNKRKSIYNKISTDLSGVDIPKYDEKIWLDEALSPIYDSNISDAKYRWKSPSNFSETDWWKFNEAAKDFQSIE